MNEDKKQLIKILAECQKHLANSQINKSGKNAFQKFSYFEIADFMPLVNNFLGDKGVFHFVSFEESNEEECVKAVLTFAYADAVLEVSHEIPSFKSEIPKGMQKIQFAGAIQTYARRYLYLSALGIVENDVIDSIDQKNNSKQSTVNEVEKDEIYDDIIKEVSEIADIMQTTKTKVANKFNIVSRELKTKTRDEKIKIYSELVNFKTLQLSKNGGK